MFFHEIGHQEQMKSTLAASVTGLALSLTFNAAFAQVLEAAPVPPTPPAPGTVSGDSQDGRTLPSPQALENEIHKRDAIIDGLLKRMDALEKEVRRPVRRAAAPSPSVEPTSPSPSPPPVTPPAATATSRTSPPPSNEEVEENVARALENTLVDQGGLLLSPWSMQIVPDFNYGHQSTYQLSFVAPNLLPVGVGNPVTQKSTRNLLEWGVGFRLGLPWDSQVSVRMPVDLDYGSATFAGVNNVSQNRGGFGDFSINLQKQIFHEKGWAPDVLLNVSYKADTGSSTNTQRQVSTFPFATGTGSGFNSLSGGVTLLKRQDPLVFLGNFSYTHNFQSSFSGVNETMGDVFFTRIAAILAASPDTSLRIGWDTSFQQNGTVAARSVPGSYQQISFMEFGAGSVLSARWFLDASINIGLTRDSPDFEFLISFPYRF